MNVNIGGNAVQTTLYSIGIQSAKYIYPEKPLYNAK
jgi:hypothetical protein